MGFICELSDLPRLASEQMTAEYFSIKKNGHKNNNNFAVPEQIIAPKVSIPIEENNHINRRYKSRPQPNEIRKKKNGS